MERMTGMGSMARATRIPKLRTKPIFATGPEVLRLGRKPFRLDDWDRPPPGFVRATTSLPEWRVYKGLAIIFRDPPPDRYRLPPFYGGRDWGYQLAFSGGRRVRGGSVLDFIVYLPGQRIGIRVQTERFHIFAGAAKQAYDRAQARVLSRQMIVRDLYEQDIMGDDNGAKCIAALYDLLGGRRRVDLILSRRATRMRR